ncbi:MAG: hypothetical protein V1790_17785 [Planctomycetota bacterium]
MTEQNGGESTRSKSREIVFEQLIACASRIVSGAVLILIAYFVLEGYRQKAAYDNTYLERRLERLGILWTATDRHGADVLKLVSGDKVNQKDLRALGESYYRDLASAGLFLGDRKIANIRSRVGDMFLNDQDAALRADSPPTKAEAIRKFRANWLDVLRELEMLGDERRK